MRRAFIQGLLLLGLCGWLSNAWSAENSIGVIPVSPAKDAPGFTLPDPSGKPVRLESFKGKVVLLNFWASWCGPCVQEMPALMKLSDKFKDKDFVVVGVALDNREKDALAAIHKFKISFPVLLDPKGIAAEPYAASALPTSYFLNRDGKIVGAVRGPRPWDSKGAYDYINSLLGTGVKKT